MREFVSGTAQGAVQRSGLQPEQIVEKLLSNVLHSFSPTILMKSFMGLFVMLASLVIANGNAALAKPEVHHLQTNGNVINLRVTINKSETVRVDRPFKEVLVGSSEVADVMPLTDRSIYVLGRKIGITRLTVLDDNKRVMGIVDVEVSYDLSELRRKLARLLPAASIDIRTVNGKIMLSGSVPDAISLNKALALAEEFAPESVINSLTVSSPQQVMLEVRFVEVNRDSTRDLGVGWNVLGKNFNAITDIAGRTAEGAAGALLSGNSPFGAAIASFVTGDVKIDSIIRALEQRGLARRLAEPNLVALSGDTASFLAGGEFPFPVQADDDKISIEFKKFGVGLAFTPTVLSHGLINLKIEPEVSELNPTGGLEVNGVKIPSLAVRRAQTTVELRDGQSFAIAGLLQASHTKTQSQLPWIGEVPVLGALFRSASYQKKETDLVIIVTPRLVKPKIPGGKLITPLDKRIAGNDIDFFLHGKQEIPIAGPQPESGHILELKTEPRIGSGSKGAYDDYKQ